MTEAGEPGHVPDASVVLVVIVRVEPVVGERITAQCAEVMVLAPAVYAHHQPCEPGVRVEASAAPLAALDTPVQAGRNAIRLAAGERLALSPRCRATTFRQVSKQMAS
jgi:hypothetical protein